MFCKHCGESISEDADFCEKCGKPQKPQNYHSSKNVKVVRYKKLDGKRIGLIAAGCAAALLILLGVFLMRKKEEKPVQNKAAVISSEEKASPQDASSESPNTPGNGQVESITNKSAGEEKADREKNALDVLSEEEKSYLGVFAETYSFCAGSNGIGIDYLSYTVSDLDGNGTPDFCVLYSYEQEEKTCYGLKFFNSDAGGNVTEANAVTGISAEALNEAGGQDVSGIAAGKMIFYSDGAVDLTGSEEYFVTVYKESFTAGGKLIQPEGCVIGLPYSQTEGEYRVVSIDKKGNVTEIQDDQTLYEGLKSIFMYNGESEGDLKLTVIWKEF